LHLELSFTSNCRNLGGLVHEYKSARNAGRDGEALRRDAQPSWQEYESELDSFATLGDTEATAIE
tara:strand:- start:397 stop:591 length:195 start_codon:yes stop_codon:yes gene_type:complete